jgi:ATP-binding cassette subfamily C protein
MGQQLNDPTETPSPLANAFLVIRKHGLWRQIPVMIGVLAASLLEGLSVASLFPILTIVAGDSAEEPNKVERIILGTLEFLQVDKSLGALVLVMIGLSVLKAVISLNVSRYVGYLVAEIATELRTRMIDAMLAARWSYYTINPIGRFASAITNEANWGATIYRTSLTLLTSAIQVLVLSGIVFAVDWQVGLVGVGMALVVGTAMRWLTRRSRLFSRRMLLTTRAIVTDLNDVVVGFKPMKAMHRHEILVEELRHETKSLRKALRELVLLEQLASRLPDLLIIGMLTVVAYIGISLLQLDLASMLVSGLLIMGLTRSFAKMQRSVRESVSAEVGYYAFMDTLRETAAAAETFSGRLEPSLRDACRLEDVTFSYGRATVLEQVSIEMKAGTITTLVGESGSGKTTTADLILGLFEPNNGRVTLDGVPLTEIDVGRWRSMIGYVPQEILLFNDTIMMNVTLGDPGISEKDAIEALERAGAMGFIRELPQGLATTVGDRGVLLSGGQRQRIALARALITKPILLILDEATSALDPDTEAEICAAVAQERGRLTVLAITHQPAWIELADRVYHIARGKVQELDAVQCQAAIDRARPRQSDDRSGQGNLAQADPGIADGAIATRPSRIS